MDRKVTFYYHGSDRMSIDFSKEKQQAIIDYAKGNNVGIEQALEDMISYAIEDWLSKHMNSVSWNIDENDFYEMAKILEDRMSEVG